MSKFEIEPSRRRKLFAIVVAITGVGMMITSPRSSHRVFAAAVLLMAWEMAFVPSLPLNLTLGEIYQRARQGWRMSRVAKTITLVTYGLFAWSIYLQLHGR